MAKKNKKRFTANRHIDIGKKTLQSPLFSHITQDISWKIIFTAITIVIIGYILLANVDPLGKNIYSAFAPVFLIGGHILVALGLLYRPKTSNNSKSS